MRYIFFLLLLLTGTCLSAQTFTNKGKEFWVGYGHNDLFANPQLTNAQDMIIYLSAEKAANVTVSINGTSWVRNYSIPAGTVMPTDLMPKSGTDDCRILDEGLSARAIHIVSDVAIVAYAHTFGQYTSGATMLLPVESYSFTYFSINSEQNMGQGDFSWFYVVANDNNTKVKITPSRPTLGGRAQNVPFEITLNKGEIYNVMGAYQNQVTTYDVSGSKIQSIPGDDGICHPVGVFSGSSRTYICPGLDPFSSGSDFNMQQVYPVNAWGTKYITALTSRSTGANVLNNNKFRVYLKEPNTVVKRNGAILSGLNNNFFFDFLSNTGDVITSNKPVMVAQFIPSATGCGSLGLGDPEMFYLSPLEQAINSIAFYSTDREHIEKNYLTLIIPDNGMFSLLIDGSNNFDYTYQHPRAPGYTVVVKEFPIPNMQHTAKSDSNFTAITYGLGDFESYGYNAGTSLKNLEAVVQVKNEHATIYTDYTCTKTNFKPTLKTVYQPSSIIWKLSDVKPLLPNADVTMSNHPLPNDSVTENGRKFYIYQLPDNYIFTDTGSYNIPVTIVDLQVENCSYSITTNIPVDVKPSPVADFAAVSSCAEDSVSFKDVSPDNSSIQKWKWNFNNGNIDSVQNPFNVFTAPGTYNVKLQIIKKTDGCVGDTIKPVSINVLPTADFSLEQKVCMPGGEALFTNLSSLPAGNTSIVSYSWDFGDGQTSAAINPVNKYAVAGYYTVELIATTQEGCKDTAIKIFSSFVNTPTAAFTTPQNVCMPGGEALFTNTSTFTNGDVSQLSYAWKFGDGKSSGATNPTNVYTATGAYTVELIAATPEGCADTTSVLFSSFVNKPVADFSVPQKVCMPGGEALFTNLSALPGGSPSQLTYSWKLGDGNISSATDVVNIYAVAGSYTVELVATANNGCKDTTLKVFASFANTPVADFNLPQKVCMPGGQALFTNTSSLPGGNTAQLSYAWKFGDGKSSVAVNPVNMYAAGGSYIIEMIAATQEGCKDTIVKTLSSFTSGPSAGFDVDNIAVCEDKQVLFTDKSVPSSGNTITSWQWNFGDGSSANSSTYQKKYSKPGNFTVSLSVKGSDGCTSNTAEKTIHIYSLPQVNAGTDIITTAGMPVTLNGTVSGTNNFSWSPPASLSAINVLRPVATTMNTQLYYLTATGEGNCIAKDSVQVTVIQQLYIPNAFSPNGDGINDTWGIPGLKDYRQATVEIYNRWGQIIYTSTGYDKPWDGRWKGMTQPAGAYYYIIVPNVKGYNKLAGSVMLIR